MNHFQKCLEMGQTFESSVYYWLIDNFPDFWVTNCSNFNMQNVYQGPSGRKKGEHRLTLPDFLLMNNTTRFWVDAKSKSKSFRLTPNPESYLTIDPRKFDEYQRVISTLGEDVFLLFGEQQTSKLHMFHIDDWETKVCFNNKFDNYGKNGDTPCYRLDKARLSMKLQWQ